MAYKSRYTPYNKEKYVGNISKIVCRSLWERSFCKYCDKNDNIIEWSSEPFSIPYYDKSQGKMRKYFPDFLIKYKTGKKYLIEVKPKSQTTMPKKSRTKRYLTEKATYVTNICKWQSAKKFCDEQGLIFNLFTEDDFYRLGIRIIRPLKKKYAKKRKSKKHLLNK